MRNNNTKPQPTVYKQRRTIAVAGASILLILVLYILWPSGERQQTNSPPSQPLATTIAPPKPTSPPGQGIVATNPTLNPTNIQPCSDQNIAVSVTADKGSYQIGEKPIFTARVTNIGFYNCVRNVGTGIQEFQVSTIDGKKIWSNRDCHFEPGSTQKVLTPGQQIQYSIEWLEDNSVQNCSATKSFTTPKGAYQITAKLGLITSPPVPFSIV